MEAWRIAVAVAIVALLGAAAWPRRGTSRDRLPGNGLPPGPRPPLTWVYFTSRLCAACVQTPGLLRDATPDVPTVAIHVGDRPDLVRALGVRETPTLLLVDSRLRIRYWSVGNPEPAELSARVASSK